MGTVGFHPVVAVIAQLYVIVFIAMQVGINLH